MTALDDAPGADRAITRTAIVQVAARLLQTGGRGAVTTRAVAAESGVQPPTIYRLFGDKDGLLDAVAEHVFTSYVDAKAGGKHTADPVADLDAAWQTHIEFGLANPATFALLSDPGRGTRSPAGAAGMRILQDRIHRVAAAGRLMVTERRAVTMIHAAGNGVLLTVLAMPAESRDPGLADSVYSAVKRAIITDVAATPDADIATAAVTLRAGLSDTSALTSAESGLLAEWLDRLADR